MDFNLLKQNIRIALPDLSPREQKILVMRFGLDDGITHTLEEVGKEFCVTRERIRQIEAKALDKINVILDETEKRNLTRNTETKRELCRFCGTEENLLVHHINHNHNDDRKVNRVSLCYQCHGRLHAFSKPRRKVLGRHQKIIRGEILLKIWENLKAEYHMDELAETFSIPLASFYLYLKNARERNNKKVS